MNRNQEPVHGSHYFSFYCKIVDFIQLKFIVSQWEMEMVGDLQGH